MDIQRGDVWFVNLDPTIGHEINKTRPAVIIQNNVGNKLSSLTIIAPITSQHIDKIFPTEIFLSTEMSGLDKDSKVLFSQIRTVDKRRLVNKVSTLDESIFTEIDEAIKISLGLQ